MLYPALSDKRVRGRREVRVHESGCAVLLFALTLGVRGSVAVCLAVASPAVFSSTFPILSRSSRRVLKPLLMRRLAFTSAGMPSLHHNAESGTAMFLKELDGVWTSLVSLM